VRWGRNSGLEEGIWHTQIHAHTQCDSANTVPIGDRGPRFGRSGTCQPSCFIHLPRSLAAAAAAALALSSPGTATMARRTPHMVGLSVVVMLALTVMVVSATNESRKHIALVTGHHVRETRASERERAQCEQERQPCTIE